MDPFQELDTELPVEVLLKIHTGHDTLDTSSDECDIESDESEDDYVEPVFSVAANERNDSDKNADNDEESIARSLGENMTKGNCLICNKQGKKHYLAAPHRRAVAAWIKTQLGSYRPISIRRIYCETCNLALTQNSLVDVHYQSDVHIKKAESYCDICQRNLSNPEAMANHLNTKIHHYKAIKKDSEQNPELALKKEQTVKPMVPAGVTKAVNRATLGDYRIFAAKLQDLLTDGLCRICDRPSFTVHYKTKKHIKTVSRWIRRNREQFRFNRELINYLICFVCNDVFADAIMAIHHYESANHNANAMNYCKLCTVHVKDMNRHMLTKRHVRIYQKTRPPLSKTQFKVISITEQLAENLTAQYCGICAKYVNLRVVDHHYWQKEHILNVRKWLRVQKADADTKLIFCEACSLNLYGPGGAREHYQNATHLYNEKTYCSKCIFRGSPEDLVDHNSKEHPDDSQGMTSTSWPQELTNFITLAECKLCSLKLTSVEQANDHYQSASHNENVQDWLNKSTKRETAHKEKMEAINDEIRVEALLKESILRELKKIVDKLYLSQSIPWENALVHLKNLNKELRIHANGNVSNIPKPKQRDDDYCSLATSESDNDNFPDFHVPPIKTKEKAAEDYAKLKLSMEMHRTKVVLENRTRIPLEIAFHYVQNLNQSLKALISTGIETFAVGSAFENESASIELMEDHERQNKFHAELQKLESTLVNDKEISVEVALDCITQFNVQLESLIQYQEDSDDSLDY